MKKVVSVLALMALTVSLAWSADDRAKELERLQAATKVLDEIISVPDKGIPAEIMSSAKCVAVVPSMIKAGFVFGGRYGKGVATCRNGNSWSAPAPIRIEGGSWGLQIGGQAIDLVMLVMNDKGMQNLLNSKFQLGADVSAAAGPVGRHAEAGTDWKMRAEVLTYSRSRGLFAGITLNGAVVKQDTDDTLALYGKKVPFETILSGKVPPPPETKPFLAEVARYYQQAKAEEAASSKGSTTASTSTAPSSGTGAKSGSSTSGGVAGTTTAPTAPSQDTQTGTSGSVGSNTSSQTAGSTSTTTENASADSEDVKDKIQAVLRNEPGLSTSNVVVNVTNDTIELSGSVPTQTEKATVRRLAMQNAGNRKVDDSKLLVK
jgi:SH3 domain-containing YSC84-like protein 1